jgi:Glycosyltransferase Family 4
MTETTKRLSIARVACIPGHRAGGMARYIHMVSDRLRDEGHSVEHIFAPDIHRDAKSYGYFDRFLTTYRAARAVERLVAAGKKFDVVDIHEPIAAFYAWKRRRNRSLPPLLVSVYGLEVRSRLARLEYLKKKGLPNN